jgi:hypothetical protein
MRYPRMASALPNTWRIRAVDVSNVSGSQSLLRGTLVFLEVLPEGQQDYFIFYLQVERKNTIPNILSPPGTQKILWTRNCARVPMLCEWVMGPWVWNLLSGSPLTKSRRMRGPTMRNLLPGALWLRAQGWGVLQCTICWQGPSDSVHRDEKSFSVKSVTCKSGDWKSFRTTGLYDQGANPSNIKEVGFLLTHTTILSPHSYCRLPLRNLSYTRRFRMLFNVDKNWLNLWRSYRKGCVRTVVLNRRARNFR